MVQNHSVQRISVHRFIRLADPGRVSSGDRIRLFRFHMLSAKSEGCVKYMSMEGLCRTLLLCPGGTGLVLLGDGGLEWTRDSILKEPPPGVAWVSA